MQIFFHLLGVIFMLSTIVPLTDCCSSRILLLKEHTVKVVRHVQQAATAAAAPSQQATPSSLYQLRQKLTQHIDIVANRGREQRNRNFTGDFYVRPQRERHKVIENNANDATGRPDVGGSIISDSTTISTITPNWPSIATPQQRQQRNESQHWSDGGDGPPPPIGARGRDQLAADPPYHIIDFYYSIMRDVLSFECIGQFLTDFCLNGGRCFRYPIGNHSFFSCECADGYVGERCESKSANGLYMPSSLVLTKAFLPSKIRMARFVFSFPALIIFATVYLLVAAVLVFRRPKRHHCGDVMLAG